MRMPMKVRIAGEYYEPVVLRVESVREHDGLPDLLTHIAPKDHAELSQNPKQNQFKVVYGKVGTFTAKHEDPARPELIPGQDPEVLNLMPFFTRHLSKGQALHLSWDEEKGLMRVIMTELEEQDGRPVAKPVEIAHIGEVKDQKQSRAITPHTLTAALLQILIKRGEALKHERAEEVTAPDGSDGSRDEHVSPELSANPEERTGSADPAAGGSDQEPRREAGAGEENGSAADGSQAC